ncbi:DNA polymerase III subunit epsilon [Telmatospirillum siberiense]|uniref:DNA polymerase III subunit epsilon n=1 Tax=Telmatospirillum siberiense TaxID=382514 RepID=A0A2N3PN01_9PROT|nr:DNA polymerase III subunit epsilon [Telmatospirillum siberiense]PKU21763.1 DNA polymerase III subunit epsilon [Telmatospirillum siberiense]
MREIVLDTETTGLDPAAGHRLVEIGCVELVNHLATGQAYHVYINPERDMPEEAFKVHGLSEEFLRDQPLFNLVAADFLEFIQDSPLVIHNAEFDMKFLNWELKALGHPVIPRDRAIDTVVMARRRFPGSPANLDALCRRFGIDNTARTKHGALLDAELLAEVYLELIGGREPGLALGAAAKKDETVQAAPRERVVRAPRPHAPSEEELAAHAEFIAQLKNPLWQIE